MVCLFLLINNRITANKPFFFNEEDHPIHISKTQINYDSKSKTMQVTAHVYIDDFESILGKRGYKNLNIGFDKEAANADVAISQYLNEKIQIKLSNSKLKLEYIGKELSEDKIAVYCYFETSAINNLTNITILNSILLDLYDDQKNLTSYLVNNKSVDQFLFEKGSKEEIVK